MNIKGSLPMLILQYLSRQPGHGYQIARNIREQSGGVLDFAEGTLYPSLHRLEREGLVTSNEEEEQGRLRRYYHLTDKGSKVLALEKAEWRRYTQVVNKLIGEGHVQAKASI